MRTSQWAWMAAVSLCAMPVLAASDYYMKLGDIKGESKDHKQTIEVMSWSWGQSQGGSAGSTKGGATARSPAPTASVETAVVAPRDAMSGMASGKRTAAAAGDLDGDGRADVAAAEPQLDAVTRGDAAHSRVADFAFARSIGLRGGDAFRQRGSRRQGQALPDARCRRDGLRDPGRGANHEGERSRDAAQVTDGGAPQPALSEGAGWGGRSQPVAALQDEPAMAPVPGRSRIRGKGDSKMRIMLTVPAGLLLATLCCRRCTRLPRRTPWARPHRLRSHPSPVPKR